MAERTVEERLADVEDDIMAFGIVLVGLIDKAYPTQEARSAARERACRAIEAIYGAGDLKVLSHERLQKTIHELESLFRRGADMPDPRRSFPE
jgi:hypothetical protein